MHSKILICFVSLLLLSAATPATDLEKRKILNDRVEILLPKDFEVMGEEMLKLKYPSERRPTLVYTDEGASINVAFNHTASRATQEQIDVYRNVMVSTFKNLYPSAEWKGEGVKEINGRKVGYMELITPAIDTRVYNLIFFTDLDGRLLLCTFNCVEKEQENWLEPAQKIMNSLSIQ